MGIAAGPTFSEFDRAPAERLERRPVRMRGHVILGDGTHHEIHLLDLSYEGCGIETSATLEPGQALKLSVLQRGAMDAVVRWTRGDKAGLAFVPEAADEEALAAAQRARRPSAEVTCSGSGTTNFGSWSRTGSPTVQGELLDGRAKRQLLVNSTASKRSRPRSAGSGLYRGAEIRHGR